MSLAAGSRLRWSGARFGQASFYHNQMFVPANRKWYRNLVIARTIADTLEAMDPRYPKADPGLKGIKVPD
jgi:hypothetical protein